jgi:hypothetical protein
MKTVVMRALVASLSLAAASLLAGCMNDTPTLTGDERFAQIGRNFQYEQLQLNDDLDNLFLLRPSDTLTPYDVYHRN